MTEEQQTHTDNDITAALLPKTGEQAYALIEATYGLPLKATTFGGVLQGKRGAIAPLACLLMEWCLDWYRPCETGKRYRGDMPYLDSDGLARDWHASPEQFRQARLALSHSGLVTFETQRHDCRVRVHWDAVAEAVRREAEFRHGLKTTSKFRHGLKTTSKALDMVQRPPLNGLDMVFRPPTLSLSSSPIPSPPTEEEAETNEARVERMLDYGRKVGRSCDRKWVTNAHEAFDAVVADGHDPALVERAWYAYVDEKRKSATDLGHWLMGHDMHDEETDEGEWSFVACYDGAKHKAEREADRERVAAGGMPNPRLIPTDEGWLELGSERILPGVDKDATREEAEAAWPAIWKDWQRAHKAS